MKNWIIIIKNRGKRKKKYCTHFVSFTRVSVGWLSFLFLPRIKDLSALLSLALWFVCALYFLPSSEKPLRGEEENRRRARSSTRQGAEPFTLELIKSEIAHSSGWMSEWWLREGRIVCGLSKARNWKFSLARVRYKSARSPSLSLTKTTSKRAVLLSGSRA